MSKVDWVAAVCGNEVRIYGGEEANGRRPLKYVKQFPHHGAAKQYAQEYDDAQKPNKDRK